MPKLKQLSVDKEFVVGKNNIGWVDSDFKSEFKGQNFSPKNLGQYQKLGKYFSNADEIEKGLNPGKCELGDVYAFLQNPPEGTKDGWSNLFLVGNKVLSVYWFSERGGWSVRCWLRGDGWDVGYRVFSPETGARKLISQPSGSLTLEFAIEMVKKEGYQVSKIM